MVYETRLRTRAPQCVRLSDTMLGSLWCVYGAVQAQEAALSLLDAARDGDDLYFWGYTPDRHDIVQGLIDAHQQHRVCVKVMVDKKMLFAGTTREMLQQVARLSSNGCLARVATGSALSDE